MSIDRINISRINIRAKEIHRLLAEEAQMKPGYQDRQRITNRYALERFLFRLGRSPHAEKFVLKGAMLLAIYVPEANRPSKDADFQLRGVSTPEGIQNILREVCAISCDDGLMLSDEGITVKAAGADREYPGYSASVPARLGAINCPIHLDFGFGEAITPPPVIVEYPSMLSLPRPRLKVYPISTIIAEKFEALVSLAMSNTRMKDFYDLSKIADFCDLDGEELKEAIAATFQKRGTAVPASIPIALTPMFYENDVKVKAWNAFLKASSLKASLSPKERALSVACRKTEVLVMPVVRAIIEAHPLHRKWRYGEWTEP